MGGAYRGIAKDVLYRKKAEPQSEDCERWQPGNRPLDVIHDLLIGLGKAFPDRSEFRHAEGNSTAHLKASAIGSSITVIIENGKLLLGTWQSVFFCEFDPPRTRKFYVKVIGG